MRRGMEDTSLVPKTNEVSSIAIIIVRIRNIPGKFNVLADRLSRIDKIVKTEWVLDQWIANTIFQLELSPCLRISSNNNDSFCPEQDTTISVQNSSNSTSSAATNMVLRGATSTGFSSSSSSSFSKSVNTSKRKVSTSKPPNSQPSHLGVIKQSIRDKQKSKNVADFVSKSRRTSTQKVYDAKWIVYTRWCHRRKVNPVSAPLTVIADFLIYLFSEKKYQINTIKGYRSMISNTLKFETGNRIGSNPALSELIRSFDYNVLYKDLLLLNGTYLVS